MNAGSEEGLYPSGLLSVWWSRGPGTRVAARTWWVVI